MSFKHACFVSYSHGAHGVVQGFMEELQKTLDAQMEIYLKHSNFGITNTKDKLYFIDLERITTGTVVDEKIEEGLFYSVCMLVAYWPAYMQSDYCMRELEGMKKIEKLRKKHCNYPDNTECLIFPVYFRKPVQVHDIFPANGIDVSKYFLATGGISDAEQFATVIDEICQKIAEHFTCFNNKQEKLKDFFTKRASFTLPPAKPRKLTQTQPLISRMGAN